jgi:hypothetical protein
MGFIELDALPALPTNSLLAPFIGLIGALLAVILKFALDRRRTSDREILHVLRVAFDRPAFKGPFTWHSDQSSFKRAIEQTIKAVNTGVLQDTAGHELVKGKGLAYIKDSWLRSEIENVERRLKRIGNLVQNIIEERPEPDAPQVIDSERDEIVRALNEVWKRLRIPTLPIPTEVPSAYYD